MPEMIYLVHIHLSPRRPGALLPSECASVVAGSASRPGVAHVVVHSLAEPYPVVGLYLQEATLERAEAFARRIWERAVVAEPALGDWELVRAEVPLLQVDEE
ncbi:hypothetical protein [Streptomyces sp. NPDC091215]|uniref:hypothetical protein n=1 Tax=Streptomyces sp. NPDC091215 TaxID=3155192 RepID=UPI0034271FC2